MVNTPCLRTVASKFDRQSATVTAFEAPCRWKASQSLGTAAGNSHLLIYSVYDSAQKKASLITAFPVAEAFVRTVLDPGGLGRGKPVQTRYNAWVDGLGGGKIVQGSREVIRMDE